MNMAFTGYLSQLLPILTSKKLMAAFIVIMVFIALIIFFINFKKKNGLIYISVPLVLNGLIVLLLGTSLSTSVETFAVGLKDILDPVIATMKKMFIVTGAIYLVIAAVCIGLYIVLKKLAGKETE